MKLLVLGATGGTGRELVERALAQGHAVRAMVRDVHKLARSDERLEVVQGDIMEPASLDRAVAGGDLVISTVGVTKPVKGDTTASVGTANLIRAMEAHGVRRLVCVSVFGIGDSIHQAGRLFRWVVLPLLANTYEDRIRQEAVVTASQLEWTIVRPTHLVDGAATGKIKVIGAKAKMYDAVRRADVATELLRIAQEPSTVRTALSLGAA
ncbi:MAG: SDR family oxidoreductase [Deltaproteobacteria bacterium]|nr:SDR family oxidoreductase [Deltaproteobacteria bacterium]